MNPADYLRVVNTAMDAGSMSFEQALDMISVPADLRESVREFHQEQAVQAINGSGVCRREARRRG